MILNICKFGLVLMNRRKNDKKRENSFQLSWLSISLTRGIKMLSYYNNILKLQVHTLNLLQKCENL